MTTSTTQSGRPSLMHEEYRFRVGSTSKDGVTRWRCCTKTCPAKVFTSNGDVVNCIGDHSHDPPRNTGAVQLRQACKRKASEDLTSKPSKLIKTEHYNDASLQGTCIMAEDYGRIRQAIYRERRKKYPCLPKTLSETFLKVESATFRTVSGENFVIDNDSVNGMIIMSCEENMNFLCACEELFCDGTFKYVPTFFQQMYVIIGLRCGWYVPLVFVFMTKKSEGTYDLMWSKLKEHCQQHGKDLRPKRIVMDFEKAALKAAETAFPSATRFGCRFHLSQAWNRKIQQLGLSSDYSDRNSEISMWLNLFYGLPFLQPEEIGDCFTDVLFAAIPDDQRCEEFADYILLNYIEEGSPYPPSLWASNDPNLRRTNNGCESFNSHFNGEFYSAHPNILIVVDVLLKFQAASSAKIKSAMTDKQAPRKKQVQVKQDRVRDILQRRNAGDLELHDMLKQLGYINRI